MNAQEKGKMKVRNFLRSELQSDAMHFHAIHIFIVPSTILSVLTQIMYYK